jgi:hypothetical protein
MAGKNFFPATKYLLNISCLSVREFHVSEKTHLNENSRPAILDGW